MLEDATENGYSAGVEKDAVHTPGPWRACKNGECSCKMVWSIPGDFAVFTARSDGSDRKYVGEAHTHNADEWPDAVYASISEDAARANARLIAAAPDLLLCLAWLLDIEGQNDRETREEQRPLALAAARAAIAKATSPQMEEG